jgi:predicted transcriptional regulator
VKTVTLDVSTADLAKRDFVRTWRGGKSDRSARISFSTPELLWRVLTAKRLELLKTMCGAGPLSMRETARRVGRDVKAVHGDLTALLNAGVIDRTDDGRVMFPYEAVKVEFVLEVA